MADLSVPTKPPEGVNFLKEKIQGIQDAYAFGAAQSQAGRSGLPGRKQLPPPHLQETKRITFLLIDKEGTNIFPGGVIARHTLKINPEDYTLDWPSRSAVVQTLGGAVIDDFGLGLPIISIRGTTGWGRRSEVDPVDGFSSFQDLFSNIYRAYHEIRGTVRDEGRNPDAITLLVIDEVNFGESDKVKTSLPVFSCHFTNFRLSRSKSRPLLFQYDLTLTVVDTDANEKTTAAQDEIAASLRQLEGRDADKIGLLLDAFASNKAKIADLPNSAGLSVGNITVGDIANTIRNGYDAATKVLQNIEDIKGGVTSAVQNVTSQIARVQGAIVKVTRAVQENFLLNQTAEVVGEINRLLESAYTLQCALKRVSFGSPLPRITALNGAGTCSSSVGTAPSEFANEENTFNRIAGGETQGIIDIVTVNPTGDTALENIEGFDPVLEPFPGFDLEDEGGTLVGESAIDGEADLTALISETGVQARDFVKSTASRQVIVSVGDTLQDLAATYLGNAARWQELAILNGLRAPYISDRAIDQFGSPVGEVDITVPSVIAGNTITFFSADKVQPGMRVYFETSNGAVQLLTVATVSHITNIVTFVESFTAVFGLADTATLFDNADNVLTRVLMTGQVIAIPGDATAPDAATAPEQQREAAAVFTEVLGIDFLLDAHGDLNIDEGDLQTTANGVQNIVQALKHALDTDNGELVYHQEYGSGIHKLIGEKNRAVLRARTLRDVRDTLLRDPRVVGIKRFEAAFMPDTIAVDTDVEITNEQTISGLNLVLKAPTGA